MRRVLVVEDEVEIADLVQLHLRRAGYDTTHARRGLEALGHLAARTYDLIVLDLGLPGSVDGLELCRRLRGGVDTTPIIMLTARAEEVDRIVGLELGADDYVTKPFSVRELVARVGVVLRRIDARSSGSPRPITVGGLRIDLARREVTLRGACIELTPREFDLLSWFARHPGHVYTREQLLDHVWGYSHRGYAHTVNSHINRLRAKFERDPREPEYILTVWGIGYKFAEPRES